VDTDADTALGEAAKRDRGPSKADEAIPWLLEFLAEYAYPSEEVIAAGNEAGFNRDTLVAAKKKLKAENAPDSRVHASNKGRFGGVWHWGIGNPEQWTIRPDATVSDTTDTQDTIDTIDTMDAAAIREAEERAGRRHETS
jgi:hypothetical protein